MAMEDARHFCQQRHGDLVTINSEAESIFLWKQVIWNIYKTFLDLRTYISISTILPYSSMCA